MNEEIIITPPKGLFEYFKKRTELHKHLVYRNMIRFAWTEDNNFDGNIERRAGLHDNSKFEEPENVGFIWLTSYYWLQQQDKSIEYTKDTDKQIEYVYQYLQIQKGYKGLNKDVFEEYLRKHFKLAFEHHYANNSHHPEFHKNLDDMSELDLIEMICDWTAMSQELKQDNGSAKVWADKCIGDRFMFNEKQKKSIFRYIKFLDEQNEQPLFVCKRGDIR